MPDMSALIEDDTCYIDKVHQSLSNIYLPRRNVLHGTYDRDIRACHWRDQTDLAARALRMRFARS